MGFLTLRKGDTDAEYFENYSQEQTEFSEAHAESLGCEVYNRFKRGSGDGNYCSCGFAMSMLR